ncbi:T9SS type B sorting domain-containing protein [Lacinutrix neustonica]|uniref:T9SS type B sorting domain-containing protein n=1 Tax=Lacinutrix neustonica TaxID=2980107 RepID=A0A9E8MUL4_9FLAO|nr:T9SS type B sorting domain-containing protein [Lacinutrix neustonica]WAC01852.1 T9SS type B sorting domain-containing protein [Lacinutrix neustonica]
MVIMTSRQPLGVSERFNTDLRILIFDRYGKLLSQVNPLTGWNGTFNGAALPTNDYWFLISRPNGKQYTGHFTLKR